MRWGALNWTVTRDELAVDAALPGERGHHLGLPHPGRPAGPGHDHRPRPGAPPRGAEGRRRRPAQGGRPRHGLRALDSGLHGGAQPQRRRWCWSRSRSRPRADRAGARAVSRRCQATATPAAPNAGDVAPALQEAAPAPGAEVAGDGRHRPLHGVPPERLPARLGDGRRRPPRWPPTPASDPAQHLLFRLPLQVRAVARRRPAPPATSRPETRMCPVTRSSIRRTALSSTQGGACSKRSAARVQVALRGRDGVAGRPAPRPRGASRPRPGRRAAGRGRGASRPRRSGRGSGSPAARPAPAGLRRPGSATAGWAAHIARHHAGSQVSWRWSS